MSAPKDGTVRHAIDKGDPNTLASYLQLLEFGSLLQAQLPQQRRQVDMVAEGVDVYNLATLDALVLPANAKAAAIIRATSRAGAAGELTPQAFGTTPAATQIAVSPCGDIVTLAADAVTDLDVVYIPERMDVIEAVFPVAVNVLTLPASIQTRGVVLAVEVEALTAGAGATGPKIILVPGAGAPAAGQCRLNLAKTTITFAAADAVTRARVKLGLVPEVDVASILVASAPL